MSTPPADRGSVTVHALWVGAVLVTVVALGLQVTGLVALRHRVSGAADLAALAGSRAATEGADPCEAAREVARRNRATLERCRADLDVVTVTATAATRPWWGGTWRARVQARAAPAWYER
ncbi:MAG: flp pilus-assembly TadE/G-like family protein [Propionibacteriales bacterium]|nr:flp pilus-assembly TadE/G-like family protein [Propionibacteriales bacterium]